MNLQAVLEHMKAILQDAIEENATTPEETVMFENLNTEKYEFHRKQTFLNGIRWAFAQLEDYISFLVFLDRGANKND